MHQDMPIVRGFRRRLLVAALAALAALVAWGALAGAETPGGTDVAKPDLSAAGRRLGVGAVSWAPSVPSATNLVGVQWRGDPTAQLTVETRGAGGDWTRAATVSAPDGGADVGSPEAIAAAHRIGDRIASEPVSVRGIDQVRVRVASGEVSDVRLVAVAPTAPSRQIPVPGAVGAGLAAGGVALGGLTVPRRRLLAVLAALAIGGTALATVAPRRADALIPSAPPIISRAQWGADESLRLTACPDGPSYAPDQFAVIHHTATSNGDSPAQSFATVRSIYTYYVLGRGYCDHGYNFLVDRYGQIFEGRFGGVDRGVIGAHATNFNTSSIGIAMIGDFSNVAPPAALQASVLRLLQWKFTISPIDPTTPVFTRERWIDPVIGHRDAGMISGDTTACPGNAGYSILGWLRSMLRATVPYGVPWSNADFVQRQPNIVRMAGWALDPETTDPIDVHGYVDANGARFVADGDRPDVGAAFPDKGSQHGFDVTLPVPAGTHNVCTYAISVGKGPNDVIRCFQTSGRPIGSYEAIGREPAWISVAGWTLDPDASDSILVDVYVDGRYVHTTGAVAPRPDIDAAFPGYGAAHGFWARVPVTPGLHTVCVYGLSIVADPSTLLGCKVA